MRRLLGNGRYANVTATLALLTAMGGTGYAAVSIAENSVGTPQLKADAVTSAKVKNGTLQKADFKAGQLPAGAKGAKGATGATGPTGPTGASGPAGPAGTEATTLASGQTLRGYVEPWGEAAEANEWASASVSFPVPLAAAPIAHFINFGDANPAGCTGTPASPAADPGHLCVWEVAPPANSTARGIVTSSGGTNTATRFGFSGWVRSTAGNINPPGAAYSYQAVWAVTAP